MLNSRQFALGGEAKPITNRWPRLCAATWALALAHLANAQPAAPTQVATPPQAGPNAVTSAVVQRGVLTCASRVEQVSNFLGFSAKAGAMLPALPPQPDRSLLPLVMEVPLEQGVAFVSMNFAPNQYNGCGASYDAISYWDMSCEQLATKQFGTLKNMGPIKQQITALDAGAATKFFLMPAGKGCVAIKKEIVF